MRIMWLLCSTTRGYGSRGYRAIGFLIRIAMLILIIQADGRLLYVYLKVGGPHKFRQSTAPRAGSGVSGSFRQDSDLMDTSFDAPSQPRSDIERSREPDLQDGRFGFSDIESRGKANTGRIRSDQGLFSDRMVQRNQNYRR